MSIKMLLQTVLVKSNYIGLKLARFFFCGKASISSKRLILLLEVEPI